MNRIGRKDNAILDSIAAEKGIALTGTIRNDQALLSNEMEGKTIFDLDKGSVALVDAYRIFDATLKDSR